MSQTHLWGRVAGRMRWTWEPLALPASGLQGDQPGWPSSSEHSLWPVTGEVALTEPRSTLLAEAMPSVSCQARMAQ